MTGPLSGALRRGEPATADPTTEVDGQLEARKLAWSQALPRRAAFGLKSLGTFTVALSSPASSASWPTEVMAVVGTPLAVCPGPPTLAVNEGEKSRASQLVVLKFEVLVSVEPE